MSFNIIRLIASILLLIALSKQPYSFYTILRICVFVTGAFGAYLSHQSKSDNWLWIFGAIALIFNPIFPIYLEREIWAVIDIVTAIVLIISIKFIPSKT